MSENVIAKRYAAALLAAAHSQAADLAALIAELKSWAEWLASRDQGALSLLSPVLAPDRQATFLKTLLNKSGAHKLTRGLLLVCLEKRRLALLPNIVAAIEADLARQSGSVKGQATAAFALEENLKQQIAEKVGAMINKKTELTWAEDRSLLGGFKVQVGQTIWDASLKHQLGRLEESIRKGVGAS